MLMNEGNIPEVLGKLSKIKILYLDDNNFSGIISKIQYLK